MNTREDISSNYNRICPRCQDRFTDPTQKLDSWIEFCLCNPCLDREAREGKPIARKRQTGKVCIRFSYKVLFKGQPLSKEATCVFVSENIDKFVENHAKESFRKRLKIFIDENVSYRKPHYYDINILRVEREGIF